MAHDRSGLVVKRLLLSSLTLLTAASAGWGHKVDPPVHQHIAQQAVKMLPDGNLRSELAAHLGAVGPYGDRDATDDQLLEGVYDEDAKVPYRPGSLIFDAPACLGSPFPDWRFWRHGWDPDSGYEDGFSNCDSSVETAHRYWLTMLDEYKNGDRGRAYWWLGRIVHLLEDKSVPAHSHKDAHGLDPLTDDNYEEFMGRDALGWPESGDPCAAEDIGGGSCNYLQYLYDEVAGLFSPPDGPGEPALPIEYRQIDFAESPWSGYNDSWPSVYVTNPQTPESGLFKLFLNLAELGDEYESDDQTGEDAGHPEPAGDVQNDHLRWHARDLMKAALEHVSGLYLLFWDSVVTGIQLPQEIDLVQQRWGSLHVTVKALDSATYELRLVGEDGSSAPGWLWANNAAGPVPLVAGQEVSLRFDVLPDSSQDTIQFRLFRKSALQVFQEIERSTVELRALGADAVPPRVVDHSPRDGGATSPTSSLTVWFSEAMASSSFLDARVSVSGSLRGPYEKIVFYDSQTRSATIRPTSDLVVGETVTVTLSSELSDLSGNGLDGDADGVAGPGYAFSFHVPQPGALDAPSHLRALALAGPEVALFWIDNASAEEGFTLWRSVASGVWSLIASLPSNTQSFTDGSVVASTTYRYRVRVFDGADSADSAVASVSLVGDAFAPDAPRNLRTTAVSSSQINLTWDDGSGNESGFKIERRSIGGSWFQSNTVSAGTEFFASRFLDGDTTYSYRIRAYNQSGNSPYSNAASATTQSNAPTAPTNLSAWATSDTRIALTWQDRSSNENGFEIERRSVSGSWFVTGFTGRDDTSFEDSVIPQSEYQYRARAHNAEGYSAYSNVTSASSCVAPDAPRLESPYNGEDELAPDLVLEWDTDDEVSSYDVYFGSVQPPPLFASGIVPDLRVSNASQELTGLAAGTIFYWQVVAHSACDSAKVTASPVRTFVTLGAPSPVELLKPPNGATDVPSGVVLDWANVSSDGPTHYDLYFGPVDPPPFLYDMDTRTVLLMEGLSVNTTYYWRVVARAASNPDLESTSPVWDFTTGATQVVTVTVAAVADAGLRGGAFANRNYGGQVGGPAEQRAFGTGNDDNFYLDPGDAALRGALLFDLSSIAAASNVTNATLTLEFAGSVGTQTNPLAMHFTPYTGAWTEAGVTWNNRPSTDPAHRVEGSFPTSGFNPLQNDVTELVGKWLDGTVPNHGLEVSLPAWEEATDRAKYFFQKEWRPTLAAKLTVTYEVPCAVPPVAANPSPPVGAVGQPSSVMLDWEDVAGASSYNVQLGTTNPPPDHVLVVEPPHRVADLQPSTTYHWRIEALAACNPARKSLSPIWSFTTDSCFAPGPVSLLTPPLQAQAQPRQVSLSWAPAIRASSYDVFFGTENPPTSRLLTTAMTSAEVTLAPATAYFWSVVARSPCNPAFFSESEVGVFSTASGPTAGAGPDLTLGLTDSPLLGANPPAAGGLAPYTYSWSLAPPTGASLVPPTSPNPTFTSTAPGIYKARLFVTDSRGFTSAPSEAVIRVLEPAQISVTPAELSFGAVPVGASAELAFEVKNLGEEPLSGSGAVASPFAIVSGSPYDLGAGESMSVVVRVSPTEEGPVGATIDFSGGGGASRPLGAVGVSPMIFSDGFETGDTSSWSSAVAIVVLQPGIPELVLHLDLGPILRHPWKSQEVLAGFSGDGKKILVIELRSVSGSAWELRGGLWDNRRDLRWTEWVPLPKDAPSKLEIRWRQALAPGHDDGLLLLSTSHGLLAWLDGIDNARQGLRVLRHPKRLELRLEP